MQGAPETSPVTTLVEDEVLSPESYVFVALMSVEEGPNKASFLPMLKPAISPVLAGTTEPCSRELSHLTAEVRSENLPLRPLSVELPR